MNGQNKSMIGRHVTSIAVALAIAAIPAFIAYGSVQEKVATVESEVTELRKDIKQINKSMGNLAKDQAVTSTRVEIIQNILERIDDKLDDR